MKRGPGPYLLGAALACGLAACQTPSDPETAPGNVEALSAAALKSSHRTIDFLTHVKPVLEAKCVVCHNRKTLPGSSFESRKEAFAAPGRIVPGHPESSQMIVNGTLTHPKPMPPVGNRLTPEEKRIFIAWVKQGAAWPVGPKGELHPDPEALVR